MVPEQKISQAIFSCKKSIAMRIHNDIEPSNRTTRSAADPLNLSLQAARQEQKFFFFSNRVVEALNMTKRSKTMSNLKNEYRRHKEDMVKMPRLA
jgi:hypothetical protein